MGGADVLMVLEHPAKLQRREVGRDRETGKLLEKLDASRTMLSVAGRSLNTVVLEFLLEERDKVPRTRVVPDDGTAERLSSLARPCNRCLTLVGDTCGARDLLALERSTVSSRHAYR